MDDQTDYTRQSPVTDPGPLAEYFVGLPTDLAALRQVVSGLINHYRVEDLAALGIPAARVEEINLRDVARMVGRLVELDPRPLTEARPKERRLIGCCRDYTVLLVAMLRHQGVPARSRVGFGRYFVRDWYLDHAVAEVWDAREQRWRLVDAQFAEPPRDPATGELVDVLDVGRDQFVTGGAAWRRCRAGLADPERFVVAPDLMVPETRGWSQVAYSVLQDLAALNRTELLLWDQWGLLTRGAVTEEDEALLDQVAAAISGDPIEVAAARALYRDHAALAVPAVITSISPTTGIEVPVTLKR